MGIGCHHCRGLADPDRRTFMGAAVAVAVVASAALTGATRKARAEPSAVATDLKARLRGGCHLFNPEARMRLIDGLKAGHGEGLRQSGATYGGITETTGNARLDQAMGIMLADLATRFGVRPGFGLYDDAEDANAVALQESLLPKSRGTVLFGRTLLMRGLQEDVDGDMFVMAICAHEFAHIAQSDTGYMERLVKGQATVRNLELHADFLSGYYIGGRGKTYTPQQLVALGRAWTHMGDTEFTNPDHHGTQEERLAAIEAGYDLAHRQPGLTILDLCAAGVKYLGA